MGSSWFRKSKPLLHTHGGLDQPSSERRLLKDNPYRKLPESELVKLRNQNLGICVSLPTHLMADFTALENVMMPMLIGRQNETEAKDRVEKILAVGF